MKKKRRSPYVAHSARRWETMVLVGQTAKAKYVTTGDFKGETYHLEFEEPEPPLIPPDVREFVDCAQDVREFVDRAKRRLEDDETTS